MRKTATRIYALFLALCLVLPMTVPAVWAANSEIETYTYDFDYRSFKDTILTNVNSLIAAAYDKEDSQQNWKFKDEYRTETAEGKNFQTLYKAQSDGYVSNNIPLEYLRVYTYLDGYIALTVKTPAAGTYQVSLTHGRSIYGAKNSTVYILDKDTSNIAQAIEDAAANETIGNVSYNSTHNSTDPASKKVDDWLDRFDLEGNRIMNKVTVGTWTADGETEHILVFKATEVSDKTNSNVETNENTAYMYLTELALTPVETEETAEAKIGDTPYATVEKAIENAKSGDEIDLQAAAEVGEIAIPAGVTLDLNGYTLTATEINSAGSIIDSSAESKGVLQGALTASGDNGGYLPVCAGENTYKFYKVTVTASTAQTDAANTAKLKFQVKFENNAAYDALKAGTSGAAIGGSFAWAANTTPTMHDITYEGATLAEKWGQAVAANGYKDGSIVLTFSGLDAFAELSVAPYIRNEETGVTISVNAVTLN